MKISRFIVLAALSAWASMAPAAPKKTYRKSPAKTKKTVIKPRKVAAKPAPPSKATRPTDKSSSAAHQKAIDLVKQATDAYAKGDYKKAVVLCKAASDSYPTYARAQTWMGASYQKLGKISEARSAYRWAIALAPGTADAQRAERGLKEIGE